MKVILKEYVYKQGVAGDVVRVADGFARNYLIPRGLAIKATPRTLRQNLRLIEESGENRARLRSMESEAAAKIDGVELVFGVKAGKNNKLYGSVTTREIAAKLLEKTEVDIDRRRISERPLRELGIHEVPVRISAQASPILRIVILREEEVAPYLDGEQVETLVELARAEAEAAEVEAQAEQMAADKLAAGEAEVEPGEEAVADTIAEMVAELAEAEETDEIVEATEDTDEDDSAA